jgi:hypothetical protein
MYSTEGNEAAPTTKNTNIFPLKELWNFGATSSKVPQGPFTPFVQYRQRFSAC